MNEQEHNLGNSDEEVLLEVEIKPYDPQKKSDFLGFDCGKEPLNRYAKTQLSQDARRGVAKPFILELGSKVAGFHTLSAGSIDASDFLKVHKGVGQYLPIPVTLIGRLAVDQKSKGLGYGGMLLIDAISRSVNASLTVASKAIIVDPIDDDAMSFYEKFGFVKIPDTNRMLLTMEEACKLV